MRGGRHTSTRCCPCTHCPPPPRPPHAETLKAFLKQLREATVPKLVDAIYNADGSPNKHWMMFSKRKFLNKEFV